GQTATKIYPFLQGMDVVLHEIRDEATVDQTMEHLEKKARPRAKTAIDHRALDLLEVLVQRRAAELQNQPAPHGDKALAALKRAFDRQWAEGEQRLMADLLAHLSKIAYEPLAKEQVRELEWLHQKQKPGSSDRLHVGHRLANIYYAYNRLNNATDLLYDALKEYQDANKGVLPADANDVIATLVSYEVAGMHHSRVEKFLAGQLQHPVHEQQKHWLVQTLYGVYHSALSMGGEVSLGKGQVLYKALEQALRKDLDTTDPNHFSQLANLLCSVYRTAKEKHLEGYVDDLHNFAFLLLPEILKKQVNHYDWVVQTVGATVHDVIGPKEAIAFLLDRIETEPAWFRLNNQDGWARHSYNLGWWRTEAKGLGDLEPRLLKVVLKELLLDLESQTQRSRNMYHRDYSNYWQEKEADFVKATEDVYSKRSGSGAAVKYIADYLYRGVNRPGRAIDILFAAHEKRLLDDPGQAQLVSYLHGQNRYAESIPLLLPLIDRHREELMYWTQLMTAYHRTKQFEKLLAILKEADSFFHQKDRWNENTMSSLGYACLDCELFGQCVEYYKEAIQIHQRTAPRRGVGDVALADYYSFQARAYSRLGKTAEAVDAASGAIVAWPAAARERANYLDRLREVLAGAADLDAYVVQLNQKDKESGQGSPIIRKALGRAYVIREQFDKAIGQFRIALELQPEDAETHRELIGVYDRLKNQKGAIEQLLASVQLSRREIALYQNLGDRYAASNQFVDAERAYTSVVELLPHDAEGHVMLAEIRQRQNRWDEAIGQWEIAVQNNALEPTGLLGLAKAQIHQKQWDKATESVKKLESQSWPARFPNVQEETRALRMQIEQGRR
ncbi:MAG TPA: tetratricopeptide repeat protein, partial [Gemmataceae bacterium]|nr:tetratricopeptide repeat protein [Gemmataceae bacterium]